MATVAERQAERERRRREAEERKRRKEQAGQQQPDQVTVVGGDPNFQLGGGTFSILGIAENQALGGAQVITDQVQFKNANDQRQFGGIVNQLVGGQPVQQNNQQAGQQPAGPNDQPNNQQAGAAGAQPGQEKPAAEGDELPDLLKRGAGLADEDDVEVEVNVDAKGGRSRHRDFVNFLATDKVPDSIFGIPVVQDESQYTEKDLEFFRRNPKAAGFYDLGDEDVDEDVPQQATGAGIPMLASIFGPVGLDNLRKANWKNLPKLAEYKEHGHEIQIGELKDVRLRKGWEQLLLRKEKKLSDLLDFSSPQGRRLITAYPGIQNIPVTNEDRGAEAGAYGGYVPPSVGEGIWLNPRSIGTKGDLPLEKQYDTILHEGINHAIFAREPSFRGPNVATHDLPSSKLTPLGYAMNLNEVLASLASRRGAERALTGRGEANSSQFAKEIFPEVIRRANELTEAELMESQGKMLREDVELPRAAVPEDTDLPLAEPVPEDL